MAAGQGADVVQYRNKNPEAPHRANIEAILKAIAGTGTRLVVNDRPDLAAFYPGVGVHVGRTDVSPSRARTMIGTGRLLGRTVHRGDPLASLAGAPVDYYGVGPFAQTATISNPPPALGPAGLAELVKQLDAPVIAIGGIDAANLKDALAAGALGVAVMSIVVRAPDPESVIADLRTVLDRTEPVSGRI
jgi:thiamine-phosphate pyrophosphorylase